MIEEFDNTNDLDKNTREEVFSQVVKAGKRTYFFDVKATRGNEYYLTITESKKRMGKDGKCTTKNIKSSYTKRILKSLSKA